MGIDGPIDSFAPFHNVNCPRGFLYFNRQVGRPQGSCCLMLPCLGQEEVPGTLRGVQQGYKAKVEEVRHGKVGGHGGREWPLQPTRRLLAGPALVPAVPFRSWDSGKGAHPL